MQPPADRPPPRPPRRCSAAAQPASQSADAALRLVSEMLAALTLARGVRVAESELSAELLRASRHTADC
ncbi:MAG: hypothetical protein ABUL62_26525 [Myxococcales bacterium]